MVLENAEENILNETAWIEFPSKKPVKELNAYNNYYQEPKIRSCFESPGWSYTEDWDWLMSVFDFNPARV